MQLTLGQRIRNAWNAFATRGPDRRYESRDLGMSSSYRPDRMRLMIGNERSIITSIYNRIAVDVASIAIRHVRQDENQRYLGEIDSELNNVFALSANLDQTGRAFIQDAVMSMFDEGCVALVPVETNIDPNASGSIDILSIRTGRILEWFPAHVRVRVYNEWKGFKEDLVMAKREVAIIENPFYSVMNEPNSTLKRLISKLNILDAIDNQIGSGKLDLIIQLPYSVKTQLRKDRAEERRNDIEVQLTGSKYGVAYADATEKITQLNRPVENNMMGQIEFLTSMLYSQLGITTSVLDGTADEKTMLNYYNRTVEPIVTAFVDESRRKFLTKTARTQKQTIAYFRDPFKLVPVTELANIADKFTRNEILSSNDVRAIIGFKPSSDPKAEELRNKNIAATPPVEEGAKENEEEANGEEV